MNEKIPLKDYEREFLSAIRVAHIKLFGKIPDNATYFKGLHPIVRETICCIDLPIRKFVDKILNSDSD